MDAFLQRLRARDAAGFTSTQRALAKCCAASFAFKEPALCSREAFALATGIPAGLVDAAFEDYLATLKRHHPRKHAKVVRALGMNNRADTSKK